LVRDELGKALLARDAGATIFLSSHDLAEIDGLATHVAFLEAGQLRLSEEMISLSGRFREVEITCTDPATIAAEPPPTWLQMNVSGNVARFVDSAFDQEGTRAEIAQRFGAIENVTLTHMTLRAIFLVLAKESRQALRK